MPTTVASLTLTGGGRVHLFTADPVSDNMRSWITDLVAEVFDRNNTLVSTTVLDRSISRDPTLGPPYVQNFEHYTLTALSGGGYAVAYDDTRLLAPGGSSSVDLMLFDAAGRPISSASVQTSSGGQPFPFQGTPQLTALANDGVALVYGEAGGQHLRFYDGEGRLLTDHAYESRPTSIYSAGLTNSTVVTSTKGGVLTRDLISHNTGQTTSQAVTQTHGDGGDNLIFGGAGPDDLIGNAGADTLQGGLGYDRLTGGAGSDTFVFSIGGGVDQASDFNSSEDRISLLNPDGEVIASTVGVLTFWRSSGVLTWDADGDSASGAAQSIGVLTGATALSAANFAPGFEPALVRVYNPVEAGNAGSAQGSRSDITFGYGKQAFTMASADYDPGGTLLTYRVDWNDDTASMTWFDTTDVNDWDRLVAGFDTQDRVTVYATYWDDGTQVHWLFDPANTQSWSRIVDQYDVLGRTTSHDVVGDDGSRWNATFDVADTQPWAYSVERYNTLGASVGKTFYNTDGSVFG